ncbi:MAG TPA: trypsin-like peptidase domain-containing protein [Gemmatimonadales bacterium]|jgi:serine protease Do|nr:trypsin-like peptidase domain-containing protein [Gemmatimonadales bacterium]
MSTHSRNWLKLGALFGLTFILGLFFAGLLDFPRNGFAQQRGEHAPIVRVNAPNIPTARSLIDLSDAYAAVVEAVRPSVVFVQSERPATEEDMAEQLPPGMQQMLPQLQQPQRRRSQQQPQETPMERGSGSGFIVSTDGYILTNNHVIEGSTKVTVTLLDGRVFPARIVGTDKDTDVGVLKIDATGLTAAALGSSEKTRVGEWVLAIGNPLGDNLTFSVTQGIVSAKGRSNLDLGDTDGGKVIQDFIQTDAVINRGNSGGPLVNVRGEVIGINAAIASTTGFYNGYAFAVPIDMARHVMDQIVANGHVERTGLGIMVQPATPEDAAYFGLSTVSGVVIDSFPASSAAKRAGLEVGDMITAIDGQPIQYVGQLQQVVGFRNSGDEVKVEVQRRGGKRDFTVRLAPVNAAADSASAPPAATTPNKTEPTSNRLGMTVAPLTTDLATEAGLPSTVHGLLVKSVVRGSDAEQKICAESTAREDQCAPEVITEVEGKPVRSEDDLRSALGTAQHGVVTLTLLSSNGKNGAFSRLLRLRLNER